MKQRPMVLTLGDPAGIGPEISLKAWSNLNGRVPFVLMADRRFISILASGQNIPVREIAKLSEYDNSHALNFLHHDLAIPPVPGHMDARNALSVIAMIERAVKLVQEGSAKAIVTNPISKLMLKNGSDFAFPGHTEFLAHLAAGNLRPVMMLVAPELRVVPVTVHISIGQIASALNKPLLEETIRVTHAALLQEFGIAAPRLAVAGLNPHAGEGGTIGNEENTIIVPVLDKLRREGMNIIGPLAADTMFHQSARTKYDVAICMYHDQALIPLKTLNFSAGVNTTLGLPFVRTSPDHGTAFDIAGKAQADPTSLISALELAWQLAGMK